MKNKEKIFLVLFAMFIVLSLLVYNIFNISTKTEEQSLTINYKVTWYLEEYNGFTIISNENNFERIKRDIDILGIQHENYKKLKRIIYITGEERCNGHYDESDFEIILYPCYESQYVRDYSINKEDSEVFILAHELGHYVFFTEFDYDNQDELADDYAHELSGFGEMLG